MDKFFGCMKFAQELRQAVLDQIGLPISFGLSINKTVSKMVTNECKPNGELHIEKLECTALFKPTLHKKNSRS
jgi:DNA polymerase-4